MAESTRCLQCTCEAIGFCDLRRLGIEYGTTLRTLEPQNNQGAGFRSVTENRFTGANHDYLRDDSHAFILREPSRCIDCGRCDKACMMNVNVATSHVVTSAECISCNECVNACPVKGALTVQAPARKRFSALASTAVVAAVLVAIVGGATLAGDFQWRQPGLAEAKAQSGSAGGSAFDTSLVKGNTTLQEIADATGIPAEELTAAFGVPAGELGKPISEIKDAYGFTPEDVRAWLETRLQQ